MSKLKRRTVRARQVMYVQDLEHLKIKETDLSSILVASGALEWAYIKHDKDNTRPHIHVIIKFENPRSLTAIAGLFKDDTQYVQVWKGKFENACSYLVHRTSGDKKKYQYDLSEVVASFDFKKRIRNIENQVKLGPKAIHKAIDDYSQELITRDELQYNIGVLNYAKNKMLIDRINAVLLEKKHTKFLKDFEGHRFYAIYLFGKSGVGKSKLAYEILKSRHPNDFFVAGSARGRFENGYQGERYVLINDLRPNNDIDYQNLLMLTDPYQHDKRSASRYHDVPVNLRFMIITTVLPLEVFYNSCNSVSDMRFDTLEQLKRRVIPIELTADNCDDVKKAIVRLDDLQQASLKIDPKKKAKHSDQNNA